MINVTKFWATWYALKAVREGAAPETASVAAATERAFQAALLPAHLQFMVKEFDKVKRKLQ